MAIKKDKKTKGNADQPEKIVGISEAKSAVLKKMEERLTNMLKDPVIQFLDENEVGDAKLYVRENKKDILFDLVSKKTWLHWGGHNWEVDIKRRHVACVDKVNAVYIAKLEEVNEIIRDFGKVEEGSKEQDIKKRYRKIRESLKTRITQLNTSIRRNNIINLAKSYGIGVPPEIWDSDPWILGCVNGVLELDTGNFREGRRADFIRSFSPTEWKGADEPCDLWLKTLDEIFAGDQEVIAFLQRVLGYALLGYVKEHAFFVFNGIRGNNGKGVIMRVVTAILGKRLASTIRSELLTKSKVQKAEGSANTALMTLCGKRLVCASETEGVFSIERVKWLTGGDELTGRNNYDITDSEWKPSHTLFIQTNNMPHVAADNAFFNRLYTINFTQSFVTNPAKSYEHKIDMNLEEKLVAEYSGILAWIWKGTRQYLKMGLQPPESVLEAKKMYIEDEDTVGRFIKAGFSVVPEQDRDEKLGFMEIPKFKNYKEQVGVIHTAYTQWCEEVGIRKPMNSQTLAKEFVKKGFIKKDGHANKVFIFGIKFLDHKWNREIKRWTKEVDVEDYED